MATPKKTARSSARSASRKATEPKAGTKSSKKSAASRSRESASLLLRGLDPEVVGVLKARAERSGRSLQQELHAALRRDARRNFDEAAAISASWHDRLRGRDLPDSTELLRDDRDR